MGEAFGVWFQTSCSHADALGKWGNHSGLSMLGCSSVCATEKRKEKKLFSRSSWSPNYAKRLSFRADCSPRLIDGCSYAVDFIHSENNSCKKKNSRFEMPLVLFSASKINDPSQGYSMFPRWGVLIWNLKGMALLALSCRSVSAECSHYRSQTIVSAPSAGKQIRAQKSSNTSPQPQILLWCHDQHFLKCLFEPLHAIWYFFVKVGYFNQCLLINQSSVFNIILIN